MGLTLIESGSKKEWGSTSGGHYSLKTIIPLCMIGMLHDLEGTWPLHSLGPLRAPVVATFAPNQMLSYQDSQLL